MGKYLRRAVFRYVAPVCVLGLMILLLHDFFFLYTSYYQLAYDTVFGEDFRNMSFPDGGLASLYSLASQWEENPYDVITTAMIDAGYRFAGTAKVLSHLQFEQLYTGMQNQKPVEYRKLRNGYEAALADLRCFPVLKCPSQDLERLYYENGWGDPRTYGGERPHEGIDLMDRENTRGVLPIVSMTDGTVTRLGWLELGGWRIGIRAPGGTYFYYAHLDSYDHEFAVGEEIRAGELLGFMGDSGYSKVPGTVGNFAVHLHFGIYLRTDHYEEMAVDPYWILRFLEDKKVKYAY